MTITKEQIEAACNVKAGWSEEAQKALEERENLELNYIPSLHEAWERVSQDSPNETRYEKDCIRLFYLAKRQLNLEKNVKKGDFEDLTLCDIKELYLQEYFELHYELFQRDQFAYFIEPRKKINYQRVREEIGDVAACLVGLLAKLNKMEKEEK